MPSGGRVHLPCRHLRWKEGFYRSAEDRLRDETEPVEPGAPTWDPRHYWCTRSCRALGPDLGDLGVDLCRPGRACYEPPAGELA